MTAAVDDVHGRDRERHTGIAGQLADIPVEGNFLKQQTATSIGTYHHFINKFSSEK